MFHPRRKSWTPTSPCRFLKCLANLEPTTDAAHHVLSWPSHFSNNLLLLSMACFQFCFFLALRCPPPCNSRCCKTIFPIVALLICLHVCVPHRCHFQFKPGPVESARPWTASFSQIAKDPEIFFHRHYYYAEGQPLHPAHHFAFVRVCVCVCARCFLFRASSR